MQQIQENKSTWKVWLVWGFIFIILIGGVFYLSTFISIEEDASGGRRISYDFEGYGDIPGSFFVKKNESDGTQTQFVGQDESDDGEDTDGSQGQTQQTSDEGKSTMDQIEDAIETALAGA